MMARNTSSKITEDVPRRRGRPPKQSPNYGETREALIRVGVVALSEKGYVATAIEDVLRQIDVPKGSFYHYFDSKDAFGIEVVKSYAHYFTQKIDHWFDDQASTSLERLRHFVEDAATGMARHQFTRGCVVGNLGQEMGALPEIFRMLLRGTFAEWEQRLATLLRAAQAAGEIDNGRDCDQLAAVFWIGWEGAVLRAKLDRSPVPLHLFAETYIGGLRSSAPPPSTAGRRKRV